MIIPGGPVTNLGHVVSLTGSHGFPPCQGVPYEYGTANNKRVFYGSQTPYTLMSAAGNSLTAKAEEIYMGGTNPSVLCTFGLKFKVNILFAPMSCFAQIWSCQAAGSRASGS